MRPTFEQVKECLAYDPETGALTWICPSRGRKRVFGKPAGCPVSDGYIYVGLLGRQYYAHCLAWLLTTGKWSALQVDHENGKRADNRWTNLREATHAQNNYNTRRTDRNTSGYKGVHWVKRDKKWSANIKCGDVRMWLGHFDSAEQAHNAYLMVAEKYFGKFARAG